jgi:hypothetical protein
VKFLIIIIIIIICILSGVKPVGYNWLVIDQLVCYPVGNNP